ncbi:hypothetical protein K9M41_00480 [Candidatus Gracilibacteria bacterium]|nr:hypothetical protein [Candidatus Gracilibacteria bacterium]
MGGGGMGMDMMMSSYYYIPYISGNVGLFIFIAAFLLLIAIFALRIEALNSNQNKMEKTKFSWIRDLVGFGGTIIGIVLTAIGGVMFLNTVLKVYVFNFETPPYFQAKEMCQNGYPMRTPEGMVEPGNTSEEDLAKCMAEKEEVEKTRYMRQQYERMVDGFSFLIVGAFFWLMHRRKRKA